MTRQALARKAGREECGVPEAKRKKLWQEGESTDQHEMPTGCKYFQLYALQNSFVTRRGTVTSFGPIN